MGFQHYLSDDFGNVHPVEGRDWNQWVSASRTRNWCKRNPLQDWLHAHGDAAGFERDSDPDPRTDLREFIFAKGHAFEAEVVALISRRVSVFTNEGFERPTQSIDACRQTFDAMTRGEPLVAQGVLWNPQNRTYGAADILVCSDVLRSLFPEALCAAEATEGAPGIGLWDCHYRVVDIKYTTLKPDKHGNATSELLPYMVQVFLYNEALGRIQDFTPGASYLLRRGWTGPGREESREMHGSPGSRASRRVRQTRDVGRHRQRRHCLKGSISNLASVIGCVRSHREQARTIERGRDGPHTKAHSCRRRTW